MHAVSTNQIADILHFNDNGLYGICHPIWVSVTNSDDFILLKFEKTFTKVLLRILSNCIHNSAIYQRVRVTVKCNKNCRNTMCALD